LPLLKFQPSYEPHHLHVPNVMEIWEPKPPGTLWATHGLLRDSFTLFHVCTSIYSEGSYKNVPHVSFRSLRVYISGNVHIFYTTIHRSSVGIWRKIKTFSVSRKHQISFKLVC